MKFNYYIVILFLFVLNSCSAQKKNKKATEPKKTEQQVSVQKTGSKVGVKQALEALEFHNAARKEVGVEPMQWSEELSKYAQEWADYLANNGCQFEHRPDEGKWAGSYGENIFAGSGKEYTVLDASKSWYAEKKYFKNVKLGGGNWAKTGHYSQMIWRNTKKLGMGIAKCKSGKIIIVANYDPAGNFMGEKAY